VAIKEKKKRKNSFERTKCKKIKQQKNWSASQFFFFKTIILKRSIKRITYFLPILKLLQHKGEAAL